MIPSLDALGAEARAVAEEHLARIGRSIDPDYRDAVLDDLRAYLADHLEAGAGVAEVRELTVAMGEPESEPGGIRAWLGRMPVDLSLPTAERVAHTWWNPQDDRLFVPRVFGLGWSLNFGAAAVKLGLIEADAEDEPFEHTPAPALRAALVVPAALAAAVGAHYLFRWRGLPRRLPGQLDATGGVSAWTSRSSAAAVDVTLAVAPTLWAGWLVGRGTTGARAAGALAAATASSALTAGLTVWRTAALDGKPRTWAGPGLLALLWLPAGAVLLTLARAGRAEELRRDLKKEQ